MNDDNNKGIGESLCSCSKYRYKHRNGKGTSTSTNRITSSMTVIVSLSMICCVVHVRGFFTAAPAFIHRPRNHPATTLFYSSSNSLRSESLLKKDVSMVESVQLRSKAKQDAANTSSSKTAMLQNRINKYKSKRSKLDNRRENQRIDDWLKELGLPIGLRDTLIENIREVSSKRIWIIDNSGSMKLEDGQCQIVLDDDDNNNNNNNIDGGGKNGDAAYLIKPPTADDCTRWAEAKQTVNCHAQLNSVLGAPTDFRLLNRPSDGGPQKFRVGYNNVMLSKRGAQNNRRGNSKSTSYDNNNSSNKNMSIFRRRHSDSQRVEKIMIRNQPKGDTPLHKAVKDVRQEIIRMLPQLRADGTLVTIVICTDGNTNTKKTNNSENGNNNDSRQDLEDALRSLSGLPVCVVIRLCTDYGDVVEFYNGLDERMSSIGNDLLSYDHNTLLLDVLDDYDAEAKQVQKNNPWLNYALVLHRMRELGLQGSNELFDLLNQKSFSHDEIRSFCALLFGTTFDLLPDPLYDEDNFVAVIENLQRKEKMHWNPRTMEISPWINIPELLVALR